MTTATRSRKTATSSLRFLARASFKATGAILYGVESTHAKTGDVTIYHVTVIAGKVRGCHDAKTGESCKGWHYAGHCKHADYVMALEADYPTACPVEGATRETIQHIDEMIEQSTWDDRRRAFESVKQEVRAIEQRQSTPARQIEDWGEQDEIERQRAAWQKMTPEQKREWQCNQFGLHDYESYSAA